jgi:hypothetical protein
MQKCVRASFPVVTADQPDELAAFDHSITSSVRASSVGGTERPRSFAVCRLMTSSNLVDWITGRSAASRTLKCGRHILRLDGTCPQGWFRSSSARRHRGIRGGNRWRECGDAGSVLRADRAGQRRMGRS